MNPSVRRLVLRVIAAGFASVAAAVAGAQQLALTPFNRSGIYALGEKVGWTVAVPAETVARVAGYTYTIKKNDLEVIKSGKLDLASGKATIEIVLDEPAMLYVEVLPASGDGQRIVAGAAVAPAKLQPTALCPADFDAFWTAKIKLLKAIPADPVLTPGPSAHDGVEYSTIRFDNINGAHIYGQLAKPAREGKFPAMLILQWANPPYPLQKQWVTDRAAEGWLALNVEPHDVPCDLPPAFYAALPQLIKDYRDIYNDDRDRNYFLQMYLGDYRALDYLASRSDWDGKTLVVMGTSMGGQQSLAVAGLHPQVTHLIVHVPAGADSNAALHGRAAGYPYWNARNPQVLKTGLYFDTVNFASRIKATCLVSMGFVDEICPPAGVWTVYNQIGSPKEVVPLITAAHNHQSTPEQQQPYTIRSAEWLSALVSGQELRLPGK